MIRAIHLSPDAPSVDILVNGSIRAFEDVEFGEGTSYASLEAGSYDLDVVPMGGEVASSVLSVDALALAADQKYTAVAFGNLASIQALALMDDSSGLAAGSIRVRAVHTAPGVGEVDIWNIPSAGDPSPLYENVPFGVAGAYLDLPAGAYTLGFDVDNDATPDVIFDLPALPAGTVANVFAVNDSMGTVFLLAQLQDGAVARIDAR